MKELTGSTNFSLAKSDLCKIGKGLGVALGGSGLAYLGTQVDLLSTTDYAWAIPLASVLLNLVRKWVTDTTVVSTPE